MRSARLSRGRAVIGAGLFAVLAVGAVAIGANVRESRSPTRVALDGSAGQPPTSEPTIPGTDVDPGTPSTIVDGSPSSTGNVPGADSPPVATVVGGLPSSVVVPSSSAPPVVVPCPNKDGSSPRLTTFTAPPPVCITPGAKYSAVIETTKGTIGIRLDAEKAPKTVNNFVYLSRYHYYDGLTFHRVVPGFIIQGGDPEGTGQGGPGYTIDDELPAPGDYRVGSVAMANAEPNLNGSQFFIIVGRLGTGIQPKYSLFGKVVRGLDVMAAIEKIGVKPTAGEAEPPPKVKVIIERITIKAVGENVTDPTVSADAPTSTAAPTSTGAATTAVPAT